MKSYHQKFVSETPLEVYPTGEISGFPVSPGMFDLNGATPLQNGVNFTIHTCGGTACELLLFHREEEEPFAVLPFPEAYKIGDVYSMIVYGLDIRDFEYAYRVDGPWDPEKGLLFDKKKYSSGSICKGSFRPEDLGYSLGSNLPRPCCKRFL